MKVIKINKKLITLLDKTRKIHLEGSVEEKKYQLLKRLNQVDNYFNFNIEELEKAMSEESELMPMINTLEDLEKWLDRDDENE